MTTILSVRINDVTSFCPLTYERLGSTIHCGYLFAARHELQLLLEEGDFQNLASAHGSATLVRVSLDARECRLTLSAPDVGRGQLWPYQRPIVQKSVKLNVSGDAVLRRIGTHPLRYQVVVGILRCAFAPMFEAWRDAPGGVSALTALWPSLPRTGQELDYCFTPLGLALEGALDLRDRVQRDVLLLPRHQPGAADGDAAWHPIPKKATQGTHAWNGLDTPAPAPAQPNHAQLVEGLCADAPDAQAWPGSAPRWAMLRWRLMTPDRQPFIDHCFQHAASNVRLERMATASGAVPPVCAELVCQLWVAVSGAVPTLEHGGMVCDVTGMAMTAQFVWDARERNSLMTARTARAALWLSGAVPGHAAALFDMVRLTLRTATAPDPSAPNLSLKWAHGQPPAQAQLTLAATGMLCGGALTGAAGIDPPAMGGALAGADPSVADAKAPNPSSLQPVWLQLEEGCLQLEPSELPLDRGKERPAQALLAAAADSSQVFRGGLPLDVLGGPPGLSAWVSGSTSRAEPHVLLRIDRFEVQLDLYDSILVWRTPGWWVCADGARQNARSLPPLGTPFIEAFASAPASRAEANSKLAQALASVIFPALWVGRAGVATSQGWSLDIRNGSKPAFVLPASAARSAVLWSAFQDAYLVQTIPAGGQPLGGPLLDPGRALVPLVHDAAGEPLQLLLGASGLPRLAAPRFPSPTQLASGWKPLAGEFFHPNVAGLTLEPLDARYTYRHGAPILADGYLRARLDGTLGSTLASWSLAAVRPVDDLAIESIPVMLPAEMSYQVHGWLAAPYTVTVSALALELGGADPHLSMRAAAGADNTEQLPLRIGSRDDGFDGPVTVVTDDVGNRTYLRGGTGGGKLLRNFGQSLWVDDAARTFRDGVGRSWTPFSAGMRRVTHIGDRASDTRHVLTQQRAGKVDGGDLGVVELILSLADVDSATPNSGGSWDLSGPLNGQAGSTPMWGPFVLLADKLLSANADEAAVKLRLGPPAGDPDLPSIAAAGAIQLDWRSGVHGWDLALGADRGFEWRMEAMPGLDTSVASVSGTLVPVGSRLAVMVNRISLHTGLGEVVLPCLEVELAYTFEEGVCAALAATIKVEAATGLEAHFVLHYRFRAGMQQGWRIAAVPGGEPCLRWNNAPAGELVLELGAGKAGAIRFTGLGRPALQLQLAQAGAQRWLVLPRGTDEVQMAGSLECRDGAPRQATQLRLAYGWTERHSRTERFDQAEAWFGPLGKASWIRVEARAEWRSLHWAGNAQPTERTLSGHLVLDNDYEFEFQQHAAAAVTMVDRVHCFFDAVALDANGRVAGDVLHAMVEHRLFAGTAATPAFSFQVPQAIRLVKNGDGKAGMAANDVILVRLAEPDAQAPHVVPQILYAGDEALGACHGQASSSGQVQGMLLRLPLRTGQGRAVLKVPLPRQPNLAWFPLVPPPPYKGNASPNHWQERRALAIALDANAIAQLCASHPGATFAAGVGLPGDGETLQEWSALARAAGWLHSGLLGTEVGVVATPYYAGVPEAGVPAVLKSAIPAALYVPDMTAPGGLRRVAQALVANAATSATVDASIADRGALLAWGTGELLRRSLRTSALVMAHGRPTLSGPVCRGFVVAAVDDEAAASPLLAVVHHPRHSALIELMRPAEAPAVAAQVLTTRTDQDGVLEVVDAQPLVAQGEPALRFRLALNPLVDNAGRSGAVALTGAALSKRQRITFAQSAQAPTQPLSALPLVSPPADAAAQVVSPMLVDVCAAVLRPGDTVHTRWALRGEGAQTGPGVELGLRSARVGNATTGNAVALGLAETASASVDGVNWVLRDVTTARWLDAVPTPLAGKGIEVTVVTPRTTAHHLLSLDGDALGNRNLVLGVAAQQADDPDAPNDPASTEATRELSLRLLEPFLCGAFAREVGTLVPEGAELAWAVAAGDAGRGPQVPVDLATVSSLGEIDASSRSRDAWNAGEQIRVVRLGPWQSMVDRAGNATAPTDPGGYSMAPGADLARLLQLTHKDRNAPRHWLLKEGTTAGPLLVLLIRSRGALSYLVALAVDWRRGTALEQPERVLAVHGGRVLGFGDLAGPISIRLDGDKFVLYNTAYALDLALPEQESAPARAWLFSRGGACAAIASSTSGETTKNRVEYIAPIGHPPQESSSNAFF